MPDATHLSGQEGERALPPGPPLGPRTARPPQGERK
jgi:hypothetical protein